MRMFVMDTRPIARQLNDIGGNGGRVADAEHILGSDYAGKYVVAFDEAQYDVPKWLEGKEEVVIPPITAMRCPYCRKVIE